jgi:uncharacterized membrane protein YhaH (DUF805 family)
MNWYLAVLKNYAGFSGRARRKEYWMFTLFNFIFLIVAVIIDNVVHTTVGELPYGLFYSLYTIAVLIPGLAVAVRRLHDVGKSGWMILIALIPIIGAIWLLVLMVTDSNPGENEYGANPKDIQTNKLLEIKSIGDTLILIVVIWMFIVRLFYYISFMPSYIFHNFLSYIVILIYLIWSGIPITLAFAIKDKTKKITSFILGGIYLFFGLYSLIIRFINTNN